MQVSRKTIAVLSLTVLGMCAPAAAGASRASCANQNGRTLAASAKARAYVTSKPTVSTGRPAKRRPGIYVCGFTRKSATPKLLFSGLDKPDAFGLNGGYAFALYNEGPSEDGQDAGVRYTDTYVVDVNESTTRIVGTAGVVLSDLLISDRGILATVANSEGAQLVDGEPPQAIAPTSSIRVFDSHQVDGRGNGEWQTIASAPPQTFTRLAVTPDGSTLLWGKSDGTFGTAPYLATK